MQKLLDATISAIAALGLFGMPGACFAAALYVLKGWVNWTLVLHFTNLWMGLLICIFILAIVFDRRANN